MEEFTGLRTLSRAKQRQLERNMEIPAYRDLIRAAYYGGVHRRTVTHLMENPPDRIDVRFRGGGKNQPEETVLTWLAETDMDLVPLAVAAGADVNQRIGSKWDQKGTALTMAVSKGMLRLAEQLIDLGADVEAPGYSSLAHKQLSPLRAALEAQDAHMARMLVRRGASVSRAREDDLNERAMGVVNLWFSPRPAPGSS